MSDSALARLTALQDALVGALDAHDLARIEKAIEELAAAVDDLRTDGGRAASPQLAREALAANQSAQTRVNFLTDSARRRLAALASLHGLSRAVTYGPSGS